MFAAAPGDADKMALRLEHDHLGRSVSATTAVPKNPGCGRRHRSGTEAKTNLSSVVVTDSAGSPVTGTLGTDYELDADAGLIKVLDRNADDTAVEDRRNRGRLDGRQPVSRARQTFRAFGSWASTS
jgi:hypothetical protein